MAQAYLLDTNYTRPPDLSNLSSIPSDDTQIIPEDESLKDTTSQSQIILEDSQIIPGLFQDYSMIILSQSLSLSVSLPLFLTQRLSLRSFQTVSQSLLKKSLQKSLSTILKKKPFQSTSLRLKQQLGWLEL